MILSIIYMWALSRNIFFRVLNQVELVCAALEFWRHLNLRNKQQKWWSDCCGVQANWHLCRFNTHKACFSYRKPNLLYCSLASTKNGSHHETRRQKSSCTSSRTSQVSEIYFVTLLPLDALNNQVNVWMREKWSRKNQLNIKRVLYVKVCLNNEIFTVHLYEYLQPTKSYSNMVLIQNSRSLYL